MKEKEGFEDIPYPVFLVCDEKINYVNTASLVLLGYKKEDLIEKDIHEIIKEDVAVNNKIHIAKFCKKDGSLLTYAYTIDTKKEWNQDIIELKGIHLVNEIVFSIIEKRHKSKEEELIELIAKKIVTSTDIDKVSIYISKEEGFKNLSMLFECTKKNGCNWHREMYFNNLHPYRKEKFPQFWLYEKEVNNLPLGIKKIIEKENIKKLVISPIGINYRTLYALSYEKFGSDKGISSFELNLLLYSSKIIEDILKDVEKQLYIRNLVEFRKKLLRVISEENLTNIFTKFIPFPYDKIIIGNKTKEENEIKMIIEDKEKNSLSILSNIKWLSLLKDSILKYGTQKQDIEYLILDNKSLQEIKYTERLEKDTLPFTIFSDINSAIVIASIEEKKIVSFILLLKKEKDFYIEEDITKLVPFAREIMLILENYMLVEELKKERKHAIDALKSQKFFLERISHEFRTPIAGILGFSELLSDLIITKEGIDYINAIRSSTVRLLNLVDKLLLLTRLESGYITISEVAFTLKELKSWVETTIKGTIKPGLEYSIDIPSYPHFVIGDIEKIKMILKELIENAIKFTDNGKIGIKIEILKEELKYVHIKVTVKDTGIGIAEDKIRYIFSDFAQEEEDIARSYEGMGLGLSIAKRMTEKMNGSIWAESNKNKGSIFSFEMKLKRELRDDIFADKKILVKINDSLLLSIVKLYIESLKAIFVESNEEEYDAVLEERELTIPISKKDLKYILYTKLFSDNKATLLAEKRNKKILIAEDNDINYQFIKIVLEKSNFICERAKNGKEALEMFQKNGYDLIIMDIQMPIMDGIQATKEIRKIDKKVPIIVITAAAVEEVKKEAKRAGVNNYITKPFVKEKIVEVVRSYLE